MRYTHCKNQQCCSIAVETKYNLFDICALERNISSF